MNQRSVETLPWGADMGTTFSEAQPWRSPGPLWEPTMHLDNHLVDAELGRGASLTPAGNQLSPWSVRFNYPYLSLNNCKCYCWSQELSRPLKTPRHFPDSLLSTGGKTMLLMSRTHHYPNSGEVCDVLKYPTCGFPVARCWRKKAAGLVAATQWERDVRGKGQNLPVGGWETPGKFLHLPGLLCCCMSSASVSGKKEWRWVYSKMGKMGKGLDSPGERALEVQMLDSVGIGRQCSLTTDTQALDRVCASPADGQLLTICTKQVTSLF